MATFQDQSVTLVTESTYKTYVAPTRGFEEADHNLNWNPNWVQGKGMRVGSRVARSGRLVVPNAAGSGDITVEATSKGMGMLWNANLGSSTSTLVSGSTYQQVHTLGDTPPSLTIQTGMVQVGGSVDAYSWLGCMCDSWELDFPQNDIATLKTTFDVGDLSTSQSYVAPGGTYPSSPNLFHFANGTIGNGTLTAPTTTALASASGTTANIRSGTLAVKNNIRNDRFNYGGAGRKSKPSVGLREITGTLVVEYDSSTYRDLVLNTTASTLLLQFTAGALSTGVETLQVALSDVRFSGDLPAPNGTDLVTQSMKFQAFDNLTAAQPIWVVARTADTAI